MVQSCFRRDSTCRLRVLPISIPALIRYKDRRSETDFGVENLVVAEIILGDTGRPRLFKSTNTVDDLTTHHNVTRRGHRGFAAPKECKHLRRLNQCVGRNAKFWRPVTPNRLLKNRRFSKEIK